MTTCREHSMWLGACLICGHTEENAMTDHALHTPWLAPGETPIAQGRRLLAELAAAGERFRASTDPPAEYMEQVDAEFAWNEAVQRVNSFSRDHLATLLDLAEALAATLLEWPRSSWALAVAKVDAPLDKLSRPATVGEAQLAPPELPR